MTTKMTASNPDLVADVLEFHRKFDLAYGGPPRDLPADLGDFRVGFLEEELDEYVEALDGLKIAVASPVDEVRAQIPALLADAMDALVDLTYVALGTAQLHGFDFAEAWRRVHAANMAKVRAQPDGADSARQSGYDVVKPEWWRAADLTDLVDRHAHGA